MNYTIRTDLKKNSTVRFHMERTVTTGCIGMKTAERVQKGDKIMKVRYVGTGFGIDSLTNGEIYKVLGYEPDLGWLRVVDDSGEDYLYDAKHPRPIANPNHPGGRFEIIEDDEKGTLKKAIYGK